MAAAGDITKALGARWHGATGTARCPAHHDRKPSLSISESQDGTPLVYCHAGCSQEAVISALRERGLWHLEFGTSPRPAAKVAKVAKVAKAPRAHITSADARALWRRGLQAQGTPVETYLRHRGFTGPIPPTIRYLPAAKHRSGTRHPTMIAAVTRTRLDDLALTGALKSRIAEMQSRLSRIEYRAEVLKEAVVSTMERAGIRKISEADFTLTLRPTAAPLQITQEDSIPDIYWRPQPPRLDRKGLIEALKDGGAVPGAVLGNGGMTISVRTR